MGNESSRVIRLRGSVNDLLLVPADLAHEWKLGERVPLYMLRNYLHAWSAGPHDRRFTRRDDALRRFLEDNQLPCAATYERAVQDLEQAVRDQRIAVFQVKNRMLVIPVDTGVEPIGPSNDDDTDGPLTWIAFEVKDQQGNPVVNRAFVLTLPDGSPREGTLDENGKARLNRIPPGNCKFTLVDPDMREVAYGGAA